MNDAQENVPGSAMDAEIGEPAEPTGLVISAKASDVAPLEVAVEEFDRMCRAFRVDSEVRDMLPVIAGQFRYRRKQVVAAIMRGRVTVDVEGFPTMTTEAGKQLKFQRPTGATFVQMEAGNGTHAQMVLALTAMTASNKGEISKLFTADFRLAEVLATLFLDM